MCAVLTCPSDAAATGSGESSENTSAIGRFSSSSITVRATGVGNDGSRSWRIDRDCSRYSQSPSDTPLREEGNKHKDL